MPPINRQAIITDQAFNSLDELAIKLTKIVNIGKTAQKNLTGKGIAKITKETKQLTVAEVELAKITKQVNTAKSKQTDEYVKQQQELTKTRKKQKELVEESGRELGTIERLRKSNKKLTEQRNQLNLSTVKGQQNLKKINKELDNNNKAIQKNVSGLEKQKINIGNYGSALGGLPGPLGAAARATNGLTSSALKFIATPIGAVIAALGLALGALSSFFKTSEEGQNSLTKITAAAAVVWDNLLDIVSSLGKALFSLIKGDFAGMRDAFNDATDGVKNFISETKKDIEIQNRISDLRAKNIKLQRTLIVDEAKLLRRSNELREQAAEIEETNAAKAVELVKLALAAEDELARRREEVTKNRIKILKTEATLANSTIEVLDEIAQAEADLENIQARRSKRARTILKEINGLERKALAQAKERAKIQTKIVVDQFAEIKSKLPSEEDKVNGILPTTDELQSRIDANLEVYKKGQEEIAKINADAEALRKGVRDELIKESIDTSKQIFSDFTALRIQQIAQELEAVEFARDRELEKEGNTERAKFDINKKFDAQRRTLEKKQLNATKAKSIFEIAINTAVGISKALASAAPPANFIFAGLVAAAGASQAAVVLAQQVPQFDDGSDNTPKDYIAGEKRPELRKSKGKWSLVAKPTLFKDSKGDQIVSGKETDSIMGNLSDLTGQNLLTNKGNILSLLNNEIKHERKQDNGLAYVLKQNNNELIRTIKNKKELNVAINTGRPRIQEKDGKTYIDRIDKYYRR